MMSMCKGKRFQGKARVVSSIQYKRGPEQAIKLHLYVSRVLGHLFQWQQVITSVQASHFCWQQSLDTRFSFFLAANQINLFGLWSTKLIPIYTAFRNYPNFLRLHFSGNFFVRCYLLRRKKGRGGNAEMKEGDKPEGIRDTCQVRTCFKQKSAKKKD